MLSERDRGLENPGVLIASANAEFRRQVMRTLPTDWLPAEEAMGGADALGKLEASECRLLVVDRQLPDLDVHELLSMVRRMYPGIDVRAFHETEDASAALSYARQPASHNGPAHLEGLVGHSKEMLQVAQAVRKVARRDTAVLITGETGTGKELIAQQIHKLSARNGKPLVVINCAAIPETLLESELFGYVRGAFTGAAQSRLGRIQTAHGGTLFLDEIGDMPLSLQPKLLRFLETGELQRLGSSETWRADVRIVSATHRNLRELTVRGQFRADLYYRLCVFPISLPPLRQRAGEVIELAEHFLRQFSAEMSFSNAALERLRGHDWPGNVRELRHVVERSIILAESREIGPEDLLFDTPMIDG